MKLSVVIVSYKSHSLLQKLLKSLASQTFQPDEVIIVDNDPDLFEVKNAHRSK